MVSEDYTVVLLFDGNDASADLIASSFSTIDIPHQLRRVINPDAMIDYLQQSTSKDASEKYIRPKLIVMHVDKFDHEIEAAIDYVKRDGVLRRIPLIVFSELSDEQSIQAAYQLKINSYIVCPDTTEQVKGVVSEVASYWLKWNQLPP